MQRTSIQTAAHVVILTVALALPDAVRAGLYYSGEEFAPLPSQWRGYLLDQRALRNVAVKPAAGVGAGPLRTRYQSEAARLQTRADVKKISADEAADLGALYVRLGEPARAVEVLRAAQREHPNHFHIAANLGTALQQLGDLRPAVLALEQAVRLAPGKLLPFEQAHLKLVRGRLRAGATGKLDDLFGVRYMGASGQYEPGKLAEAQRKMLPSKAAAIVQQLGLWLPADGPLLWQAAELAAAHGDVRSAAAMMEGCVVQYGMTDSVLREHRRALRVAADELPKLTPGVKAEHAGSHQGSLRFRSRRPLMSKLDQSSLPPISATGTNAVPWEVFSDATVERPFRPRFPKYLHELEGKTVELTGFMIPLREVTEIGAFLFIESPVGCWYCEMPERTGIVYVELPAGRTAKLQRGQVRVAGRLSLNATDPEDFLFALRDARVGGVD